MPEARTECAIVDRATDLKQKISAASQPAHLLVLVHPPVHQEIGHAFGDRRSNPQASLVPLSVIDQPVTDEVQAALPERLEQFVADIASASAIAKEDTSRSRRPPMRSSDHPGKISQPTVARV